jgi:hypothetical protein
MSTCAKCRTEEADFYENGVPLCFTCANVRQEAKLDKMERTSAASVGGESQFDKTLSTASEDQTRNG